MTPDPKYHPIEECAEKCFDEKNKLYVPSKQAVKKLAEKLSNHLLKNRVKPDSYVSEVVEESCKYILTHYVENSNVAPLVEVLKEGQGVLGYLLCQIAVCSDTELRDRFARKDEQLATHRKMSEVLDNWNKENGK